MIRILMHLRTFLLHVIGSGIHHVKNLSLAIPKGVVSVEKLGELKKKTKFWVLIWQTISSIVSILFLF